MAWSHWIEGGALGPGLLSLLLQGLPVLHGLLPLCGRLGVAGANGRCRNGRLPLSYVLDALRVGMLTLDTLLHGGKRSRIQGAPLLSCGLSWQSSDEGQATVAILPSLAVLLKQFTLNTPRGVEIATLLPC